MLLTRRLPPALRPCARPLSTVSLRPPLLRLPAPASTPRRPPLPPPSRVLLLSRTATTTTAALPSTPSSPPAPPEVYSPPKTGLLSLLPSSVVPYAELIRLDKPTGTLYLLMPCIWSTLLAASLAAAPVPAVLHTLALFSVGALIMRGAGCTINDLWDRRIDPLVARTRLRPLARGAITPGRAVVFTGGQLLAGLALLVQFPAATIAAAVPSLLPVAVYPLTKRLTDYPQVFLGVSFSWGALLGFPALGLSLAEPAVAAAAAALYASNLAWTVLYDTVYAHQDVRDDRAAGVRSTAVRHTPAPAAKRFMARLAVAHVALLAAAGYACAAGPVFYLWSCGGAAAGSAWMLARIRLAAVDDCWAWFKWCAWAVGGVAIAGGCAGDYAWRRFSGGKERSADAEQPLAEL